MTVKIDGTNTVANPAFTGADTDTGLQCGTNELKLVTGGTARATVDSSGHLGLGTTSPAALGGDGGRVLHVAGANNPEIVLERTTSGTEFKSSIRITDGENTTFCIKDGSDSAINAMSIDPSGRLFVGTTSELLSGDEKKLQITHADAGAEIILGRNDSSVTSGNSLGAIKFVGNDGGTYQQCAKIEAIADGTHANDDKPTRLVFSTTGDGASSPTERLRIDSAGIVELRANQGTAATNIIRFNDIDSSTAANQKFGQLQWFSNDASGGGPCVKGQIYVAATDTTPDGHMVFETHDGSGTTPSERVRISSDGKVRIGMSDFGNDPSASNAGLMLFNTNSGAINSSASATTGSSHAVFYNPNGVVGQIQSSGSSTSYLTSSDYRLKENVVDLDGAITRVKQLAPKRFNFIADADTTVDGFLAHEAQTVVPEAVTGTHNEVDDDGNAVMQGIDQSKLVPLLTAALQEAISRIETLEAQNTAQQAQIDDLLARVTALEATE